MTGAEIEDKLLQLTRSTCIVALNRTIEAVATEPTWVSAAERCGLIAEKMLRASSEVRSLLPKGGAKSPQQVTTVTYRDVRLVG